MSSKDRHTLMRSDLKRAWPETRITSKWQNLGDTNLGKINMEEVRQNFHKPNPLDLIRRMLKNGIVQAACFPPTMLCPELMLECAKHYNHEKRCIMTREGKVLAYLRKEAIAKAFDIPSYKTTIFCDKESALQLYLAGPEKCMEVINNNWLVQPMPHVSKVPKKLHKSDFHQEINYMVVFLNRIMGCPQSANFEPWMFFYIEEIISGKRMIDWAEMISSNIDDQLKGLQETKTFYMSSYVIYMLTRNERYLGLNCKGRVGNGEGQFKVYDCYP